MKTEKANLVCKKEEFSDFANYEEILALAKQTLRTLNWQNWEIDKQTRAVRKNASQIGDLASQISNAATQWFSESVSHIEEKASTLKELETQTMISDRWSRFTYEIEHDVKTVDNDMSNTLQIMGAKSNPRLRLLQRLSYKGM